MMRRHSRHSSSSSSAGGTDGGLALDAGAWPIVHGSPESLDYTVLPTPTTAALRFYNTQGLGPSTGDDGGDEEVDGGALLAAMQRAVARAGGGLLEGLLPFAAKQKSFSMADANPVSIISERVSDQEQRLWTSGFKNVIVFRQRLGQPELELLARYDHGGFDFHYHGSYAFVGRRKGQQQGQGDGGEGEAGAPVYVVAVKQDVYRFTLEEEAEQEEKQLGRPPYRLTREGPLRVFGSQDDDDDDERNNIVGVTLAGDGTVLLASKGGNVTALREESEEGGRFGGLRPVSYLPLQRYVGGTDPIHISNSLAVHGQGVFIATQEELVRVDVDPSTSQLQFRWAARYGRPGLPWYTSRLGPGSGSTPSVTRCLGKDVVVLTDGELGMALVYLDAETGEELGRIPVDFGEGVDKSRITSEQSVAVRGCQAFVVNNYVGTGGLDDDAHCTLAPTPELKQNLAAFCNALQPTFIAKVCPAVFGCVGFGAAMYELQQQQPLPTSSSSPQEKETSSAENSGEATPQSSFFTVRRLWARPDVSCGTSIPLIAEGQPGTANSTTYCVGMPRGASARWHLLAFDTETGADRFRYRYYGEGREDGVKNFFANPYYAGVEAVGGGALAIGSIGGVIYLTPEPSTTTTTATAPSSSSSSSSSSVAALTAMTPVAALIAAAFLLLAAVVLRRNEQQGRQGRQGPRLSLLEADGGDEGSDGGLLDQTLLPSNTIAAVGEY